MSSNEIQIINVDYTNPQHAADLLTMMDSYASDIMGGGQPLVPELKARLVPELAKLRHAFSVLCYRDEEVVALANCFYSFSTFKCKPIINIHDFVVRSEWRGQGISQRMLEYIEGIGRRNHCCKITLEVLANNISAQKAYAKFGFAPYQLDPSAGCAQFWQKEI